MTWDGGALLAAPMVHYAPHSRCLERVADRPRANRARRKDVDVSTENDLPALEQLPDARAAIAADAMGRVLATAGEAKEAPGRAARTAATLRELQALAHAAGLGALDALVIRCPRWTTVTAVRQARFVQALLDPAQSTTVLERALAAWAPRQAAGGVSPDEEELVVEEVAADAAVGAADLASSLDAAAARAAAHADAWTSLRRTLVRGQLTEAAAHRDRVARVPGGELPAAGAEPLDPPQRERCMDALLEGIGCVLSGDAVGGLRTMKDVAAQAQPNLSFRWLAVHWSALASLQCGDAAAARRHARQALLLSRLLDPEAQAISQWAAAEVLLREGDQVRALDWSAQARVRFERLGDTWGLGRACFTEARILSGMGRDEEAVEAARRAWSHDAAWDEPPVFLARRAIERGALQEAEETIRMVGTAPAERLRLVSQAVRQNALAQADAVELLRHLDAAPSADAVRALERVAQAAPRLPVPREALAWMLLRAGKYADAGRHFTALAGSRLPPTLRSSVMLGLGCVANAQQAGERPEAGVRPAVAAGGAAGRADGSEVGASTPALSSSVAAAPGAVFSGQLSVFAVPDLLEFLRGARRTGLLLCTGAAGTAALRFRDGRIAGAASPATPGLGELLVRARKLPAAALHKLLERRADHPGADGVLGEVLVREGLVSADDVRRALREQIGLAVRELIGWRDGEFAFNREEEGQGQAEIPVEVDPQEVLLNALKELDEASRTGPRP